jgi:hypothetical protein
MNWLVITGIVLFVIWILGAVIFYGIGLALASSSAQEASFIQCLLWPFGVIVSLLNR